MENASKALIIAGAILLAILIIALGVMVYNNAKESVSSADMSSTEITAFNSQWTQYLGTSITASELNALLQAVQSNNIAENQSRKCEVHRGTSYWKSTRSNINFNNNIWEFNRRNIYCDHFFKYI